MRDISEYGQVINSTTDVLEALYANSNLDLSLLNIKDEVEIRKYNHAKDVLYSDVPNLLFNRETMDITRFDSANQEQWFIPENFEQINVDHYLAERCNTRQEAERVVLELDMFEERDMIPVLRYMIYLVDLMRKNNIVWGVGRGSSVSSFCLYLIGINKINPLKYDLEITEFLR